MEQEGPYLQYLTRRLAECPAEFLDPPRIGKKGEVFVDAVVFDLLLDLGGYHPAKLDIVPFQSNSEKSTNRLRLVLIAAWLLHDRWFTVQRRFAKEALAFLRDGPEEIAALISAEQFVLDPDRREELARLCLAALGLRPKGESSAQAEDRLVTLSSVKRSRFVRATFEKMKQARKLREAMEAKAAREASARAMRE